MSISSNFYLKKLISDNLLYLLRVISQPKHAQKKLQTSIFDRL